ncbi:RNase H domain-containing protein [Trichonephila clavipes]|nr:RNase H domain-containing protein [Trichonephila clavipes]
MALYRSPLTVTLWPSLFLKKYGPMIPPAHKVPQTWVPSHVNVCGNDIADGLTREGSHKNSMHGGCLTFSEIATRVKQDVSSSWKQVPVHEWYEGNHPGAALLEIGSRRDETTLARFRSGHTRVQRHVAGLKV